MAQYKVTSSELKNAANSLRSYNNSIKNQLESLVNQEQALNNQWDGDANDAFHRAFTTNKAKFDKFVQAVEKFSTTLTQVAERYDQAESKNTQIAGTK